MESLKTIYKQSEAIENALSVALSRGNKLHIGTHQKSDDSIEQRFFKEYFMPGFVQLYRETYHEEVFRKPDTSIEYFIADQNKRLSALCLWVRKNGFFHCFENEIFLIDLKATLLMYSDITLSVKRYTIGEAASFFPTLVEAYAELDKKANRIICFLALFAFIGIGSIVTMFSGFMN